MDYTKTVVSCPIAGVAGWGGAMGPAQFIASTWKLIDSRVAQSLGKTSSNPWAAPDAIMASATYLSDLGANTSYASQIKAACKYYGTGGSSCSYGKSVMGRVAKIQDDIDFTVKYGASNR
jgi:membrane-bound lytic murein transglycosylase B